MNFNLEQSIDLLERAPVVYRNLFQGLPPGWIFANEGEETWSAFDIVGHLIHGENTDWIPRARIILNKEDKTFEPFDRFAQKELSKGKTMQHLLDEFESLRKENVKELRSWNLTGEELKMEGRHPELGAVTLQQLIATWTIHDLNHIHQASRVMVKFYKDDVGPWAKYIKILN